jgi:hypothetical protein
MTMRQELRIIPARRIPIIRKGGDIAGTVGNRATQATVSRFLGHPNARLGEYGGRRCWIEQGTAERVTSHRPRPETANHKAARGSLKAMGK